MTWAQTNRIAWHVRLLLLSLLSPAIADEGEIEPELLTAGPPIYPSYCLENDLQGYVDFVFAINSNGRVQDATVLDVVMYRTSASQPITNAKARKLFISAATQAIGNFRYKPPTRDGQAITVEGVRTRITFALGN